MQDANRAFEFLHSASVPNPFTSSAFHSISAARRRGVDMGPSALRIAGLGEAIARLGRQVIDKGNLPAPIRRNEDALDRQKKYIDADRRSLPARCMRAARRRSRPAPCRWCSAATTASRPDRSRRAPTTSAGSERQAAGPDLGGRHGDMNTPQTTTSGNVHGMPLAALLGQEPQELASIGGSPEGAARAHRAGRHSQSRR